MLALDQIGDSLGKMRVCAWGGAANEARRPVRGGAGGRGGGARKRMPWRGARAGGGRLRGGALLLPWRVLERQSLGVRRPDTG